MTQEQEFLLIGDVDKIRKQQGHYIWVFPIKWRDDKGNTYKESFGYEIEFENGENSITYGYSGEPEISTYYGALKTAVEIINQKINP